MWTNIYEDLLVEWVDLREHARTLPIEEALLEIQNWWDRAPISNPYLHVADYDEWPLPWDLLAENAFDDVAKCLGICYTILLLEHKAIKSLYILQSDNYTIVQVNDGQFILNDQPGEITADLSDFSVRYSVDCQVLKNKLK